MKSGRSFGEVPFFGALRRTKIKRIATGRMKGAIDLTGSI